MDKTLNKLETLKAQFPSNKKEIDLIPQYLDEDEKILHALHCIETIKKNDFNNWFCIITDKKILMLNKSFLTGLKTKIIPLEKINFCEKNGLDITLNISGVNLKIGIYNNLNCHILYNVINAFLNKNDLEKAVEETKNNKELTKSYNSFIAFAKVIIDNFQGFLILGIIIFSIVYVFFSPPDKEAELKKYITENIPNKNSQWGPPHLIKVSEEEIGENKYPFKVKDGYVVCSEVNSNKNPNSHHPHVLFFNPEDKNYYALSGSAIERTFTHYHTKDFSFELEPRFNKKCDEEWNCFNYIDMKRILKYNHTMAIDLVHLCNDWYDINVSTYLNNVLEGFHYKSRDFYSYTR